jgi:hypothetical protein
MVEKKNGIKYLHNYIKGNNISGDAADSLAKLLRQNKTIKS